jgi:hypothetical protein
MLLQGGGVPDRYLLDYAQAGSVDAARRCVATGLHHPPTGRSGLSTWSAQTNGDSPRSHRLVHAGRSSWSAVVNLEGGVRGRSSSHLSTYRP